MVITAKVCSQPWDSMWCRKSEAHKDDGHMSHPDTLE